MGRQDHTEIGKGCLRHVALLFCCSLPFRLRKLLQVDNDSLTRPSMRLRVPANLRKDDGNSGN
jgi:hypothetical protein